MPHLVILYTPNLERKADMTALCRKIASTMLSVRDEAGKPVFPPGGTRVLAYPAAHYAVADDGAADIAAGGRGDYSFVFLNLRMASGRTEQTLNTVGQTLQAAIDEFFKPLLATEKIGVTFQIDESQEVFNGRCSTLHPLFQKS